MDASQEEVGLIADEEGERGGTGGTGVFGRGLRAAWEPVRSFRADRVPAMSRVNYSNEMVGAFFLPMLLIGIETPILAVLVRVGFEGRVEPATLNLAVAVISSSVAAANILSFVWVRLTNGCRKVPVITAMQVSVLVIALAIAAVHAGPRSETAMWGMVLLAILARICWAGIITLRSTVWRMNYDRPTRAKVTGLITSVQTAMLAGLGSALALVLEADERLYHWVIPGLLLVSLVGIWRWTKVRVRGEPGLLRAERGVSGSAAGLSAVGGASFNPMAMVRVLRNDGLFARYMGCMFLLGTGNLAVIPLLVVVLREQFGEAYMGGIGLTHSIPLAVMPLTIPMWTKLLQRVHVIRFRAIHAWVFVAASVCAMAAALMGSSWMFVVWALLQGLGFAGGTLAWNLGHLDFAPPGLATQYMGVHVTLTGVRGILAPFLGVGVYQWMVTSGAMHYGWSFGVSALLSALGAVGFVLMSRRLRVQGADRGPIETAMPSVGRT